MFSIENQGRLRRKLGGTSSFTQSIFDGQVVGLEFICFEIAKGRTVTGGLFLKIKVGLQSKGLFGGNDLRLIEVARTVERKTRK